MNDRQLVSQHLSGWDKPRFGAREATVMCSVVKNVVINMESVLSDLQGIMGEITTIVEQIDTVTDKMDRKCMGQKERKVHLSSTQGLQTPQYKSYTVSNRLSARNDTDRSLPDHHYQSSGNAIRNVLEVKGFSRAQEEKVSTQKNVSNAELYNSKVLYGKNWQQDVQIPLSKSFSHFHRDGYGSMPQSGAIAIVYPTIISNPSVQEKSEDIGMPCTKKHDNCKTTQTLGCVEEENMQNCSHSNYSTNNKPENTLSRICAQESKLTKKRSKEIKQIKRTVPDYIEYYQTPFEDPPLIVQTNKKYSQFQSYKGQLKDASEIVENVGTSTLSKLALLDEKFEKEAINLQPKIESGDKFQTNLLRYSTYEQPDVCQHTSPSGQNRDVILSSHFLKHSQPKSVYSKAGISPENSESENVSLQSRLERYFYSMESDLDSDSLNNHGNRCATPVIDWSYLNLVGNKAQNDNPVEMLDTKRHQLLGEILPSDIQKSQNLFAARKDDIVRLQENKSVSMIKSELSCSQISSFTIHVQNILVSPVWTHIFCSEVGSGDLDGYCGCYESLLDSVLENISGPVSFEEDPEEDDSFVSLNNTYLSFDDEYEEDDWDMGLKSNDEDEYELSSFNEEDICEWEHGSSVVMEGMNCIRKELADNSHNFKRKDANFENNNAMDITKGLPKKDVNRDDGQVFSRRAGNLSTKEVFRPINQEMSDQHHTSLRQKPFKSKASELCGERALSSELTKRGYRLPPSDVTSRLEVRQWFPSSSSSLDTTSLLSDADYLGSLSDGEDLLATYDDTRSLNSEPRHTASMTFHKAKMRRLRRDFFKSFYSACENTKKENDQEKESLPVHDENICLEKSLSGSDKNRDNISESESYQENVTSYNKNINPWTAFALVHVQPDDMSDSSSDIYNDKFNCSKTISLNEDNYCRH